MSHISLFKVCKNMLHCQFNILYTSVSTKFINILIKALP